MLRYLALFIVLITITNISDPVFAENETWTLGEAQGDAPLGRICHTAVHDYRNERMLVYGGAHFSNILGDLWELSDSSLTWNQLFPQNSGPGSVYGHAAIFNPEDTSMIVFGGYRQGWGYSNQVWVLDLESLTWSQITPAGLWPPATNGNYAAYWPEMHKLVMFGGRDSGQRFNTTWFLDLETYTWELLAYQNLPPTPREGSPILILEGTSTMMVYGGWSPGHGYYDELWTIELNSGTCTQFFPDEPHPLGRNYCPLIYDKDNNRALLFDGFSSYSGQGISDLWQIGLDSMQYTELFPAGTIPSPRGRFTTIVGGFEGHRATIFGGADNFQNYFNDVYFLDWDVIVNTEEDREVLPAKFMTLECYPNPFNASVNINLILDQAASVSLAIYDIQGRQIDELIDGSLSAGEYTIAWDGSASPSGIYFARLRAGDISKSVKMLLMK